MLRHPEPCTDSTPGCPKPHPTLPWMRQTQLLWPACARARSVGALSSHPPAVTRSHHKTSHPQGLPACVLLDFSTWEPHDGPLGCQHCPSLPECPPVALSPCGCRGGIPGPVGDDNTCPVLVVPIWHVPNYLNNVPTTPINKGVVRWELEFHPSRQPFHKGEKGTRSL